MIMALEELREREREREREDGGRGRGLMIEAHYVWQSHRV